jgi:cytoskeletal protein RodZ
MVRISTLLFFSGLLLSALLGLYAARLQSAAQIKRHSTQNDASSESNQQTSTTEHHHTQNDDSSKASSTSNTIQSDIETLESTMAHQDL